VRAASADSSLARFQLVFSITFVLTQSPYVGEMFKIPKYASTFMDMCVSEGWKVRGIRIKGALRP